MNNREVVTAFLNHLTGEAPNLKSEIGNITKYSSATSKHYYYVRPNVRLIVRNVPINTQDLKPYIDEEAWFYINENLKNK